MAVDEGGEFVLRGDRQVRVFVTGGAGFIGSNLIERLLSEGHAVTAFDDLSRGRRGNLARCFGRSGFRLVVADLLDLTSVEEAVAGHDVVFHLAANSDIGEGRRKTNLDLREGTLATYHVVEAMRRTGVRQIVFSSSSVVYGEPRVFPTPEDYGPLLPISLYGASKLACEGLISAFCHNFGLQAWIFRFANICGRPGTHGALTDFIHKLLADRRRLEILGDGEQAKTYLHVSECLDGVLFGWRNAKQSVNYFNLGCEGATSVRHVAEFVLEAMELHETKLVFTGGERGWPGDVPQVRLDCSKLQRLGWTAKLASDAAVRRAAAELVEELACRQSS
jgi:UDP-glucose 4-epimerase